MRIKKPNRRRQQDALGRKRRPMPMNAAGLRDLQRLTNKGNKKPPKKRREAQGDEWE
jgi:hypothetical protein